MSAQFGLTIGLGLVGGFLGGPIGFSLGSIAGSVLGGVFFGPKQPNLKGPRLSDTRVQLSTYGVMIPIVHGAVRIAGNVIAMPEKGIEEVKKTESAGGKGGPSQTLTTFRYFATLELALCEAPAEVLAVWADSKLIYDTRTTVKLKKRYKKTRFRIRKGEETQLPDPIWEAEFGAGNVPAGRGVASVVIERLPLEDFGNRIPNFTALVSRSASAVQDPIEHWSTAAAPTPTDNWLLDRPRSVLYNLGIAIPGDQRDYFIKYDAITGAYLSDSSASDLDNIPVNGLQFDIDKNGFIYVAGDPNGSYGIGKQTMVRVDPSLKVVQVGIDSLIHIPYTGVGNPTGDVLVSDEADIVYAIESGVFPAEIFGFKKTSLTHLWTLNLVTAGFDRPRRATVDKNGNLWVLSAKAGEPARLVRVSASGVIIATYNLSATFPDASIVRDIGYWAPQHKLVIGDATRLALWDIETSTLGSALAPAFGFTSYARATYRTGATDDGTFWITQGGAGQGWQHVDLNTDPPTLVERIAVTDVPGAHTAYGDTVYDETHEGIIAQRSTTVAGDDQYDFIPFARRKANQVVLKDIVTDLCVHADLTPADLNVSQLTDLVDGFAWTRQASAREMIQPLSAAYFFDGVNSDGILKFPKRGGLVQRTIAQGDLAARAPDEEMPAIIAKRRSQETEVPRRVTVRYWDINKDYEEASQTAVREEIPSDHELTLDVPVVLSEERARQVAEVVLHEIAVNRDQREIRVGPKHLRVDPTDVIEVEEFR